MDSFIKAVFRNGVFVQITPCDLPENTEVRVYTHNPFILPATVTDPEEKKRILREVVESMQKHPIPIDAPRFTREELHERR